MKDRVSIVSLGHWDEANALRALLETMQMEVRFLRPKQKSDVTNALTRASEDDVVVLSAQGGPRGLLLGDLTDAIWHPATDIFEGVKFRTNSVLISTASVTRENGLVDAMLISGGHLIAPNGTPDRRSVVPWIGACLLRAHIGLAEAVLSANALVEPDDQFSYG